MVGRLWPAGNGSSDWPAAPQSQLKLFWHSNEKRSLPSSSSVRFQRDSGMNAIIASQAAAETADVRK